MSNLMMAGFTYTNVENSEVEVQKSCTANWNQTNDL